MGSIRTALQLASTLGVVTILYVGPWLLAAAGAMAPQLAYESEAFVTDREAELVYLPPAEPDEPMLDAEPELPTEDPGPVEVSEAASPAPTPEPVAVVAVVSPDASSTAPAPSAAERVRAAARQARARSQARARARRAPRELTRKQKRRRARRKRQRERMARQPQCHEMIDQIVPLADGEWLVGRELANCYRAHPRQFARMGGLAWVEDDDDKHVGLKVLVSRHARGDIARAVGFQRGDVLRSLNGIPLRSTAGSGFAMMQLVGGRAKVKFLRDGVEHRVVLRVVGERKLARARERAAREAERLASG